MSIEFPYDEDRATQAVLWLLKQHTKLDLMKLLKLIFLADVRHLETYGRPIVGGHYCAMKFGPVGSELYDQLKEGTVPGAERSGHSVALACSAQPDEEYLSESDLDILRQTNDAYGNVDTFRLSEITHGFAAWEKNFKGGTSSYAMPYEDFFGETSSSVIREMIEDTQEATRILG